MATTHTQIAQWASEYLEISNEISKLEARKNLLREHLLASVPEGEEVYADGRKVIHSASERKALDTKALKSALPEVYEHYCVSSPTVRLTVR